MKRPAFQFYPSDWRKDMALQSCSVASRGLWMDCLCIAHECEPYGHLVVNGKPMTAAQIGRHTGLTARECQALLDELEQAGVLSKTVDGTIYSRRMVRDEDLRNRRAAGGQAGAEHGFKGAKDGSKGGRPKHDNGGFETPLPGESKPPPSSSSSSSTSVYSEAKASGAAAPPASAEVTPMSAKERVWALGVPLLGDSARSMLGKLAKAHTDEVLASVLAEATLERPIDPKAWVIAACEARSKRAKPANGSHVETMDEIFANPRPDWAVKAGFPDRFQAENAGCTAKTAHQFRGGQRVAA